MTGGLRLLVGLLCLLSLSDLLPDIGDTDIRYRRDLAGESPVGLKFANEFHLLQVTLARGSALRALLSLSRLLLLRRLTADGTDDIAQNSLTLLHIKSRHSLRQSGNVRIAKPLVGGLSSSSRESDLKSHRIVVFLVRTRWFLCECVVGGRSKPSSKIKLQFFIFVGVGFLKQELIFLKTSILSEFISLEIKFLEIK